MVVVNGIVFIVLTRRERDRGGGGIAAREGSRRERDRDGRGIAIGEGSRWRRDRDGGGIAMGKGSRKGHVFKTESRGTAADRWAKW
jgi:hypothetical protein